MLKYKFLKVLIIYGSILLETLRTGFDASGDGLFSNAANHLLISSIYISVIQFL